jgi:small subunit ribosomal protein S17
MTKGLQNKKTKVGIVVSDAMDKSVTVMVERTVKDPEFEKYMKRRKKFMAHDEKNECKVGDTVMIRECRPLSKNKCWKVAEIVERAKE